MENLRDYILNLGADLVGFADLTSFVPERRRDLPYGIAIALAVDPVKAALVLKEPTMAYYNENEDLSARLDEIGLQVQEYLVGLGYRAVAQTISYVKAQRRQAEPENEAAKAPMPHKTIAALSGLGWVGKNTLLITEKYGSAVRLASILTDAPLPANGHGYMCRCGSCHICMDACPGGVIKGQLWTPDKDRDELIDYYACRKTVIERGQKLGITYASCGICMASCPYTLKYLHSQS